MTGDLNIAVHALVLLNHKREPMSCEVIANNICTQSARVKKIMNKLLKSKLVAKKEGMTDSYEFVLDPKDLTLGDIAENINFKIIDSKWRSGDLNMECLIASGMADIMDDIYIGLNHRCLQLLKKLSIQDIDDVIFNGKSMEDLRNCC